MKRLAKLGEDPQFTEKIEEAESISEAITILAEFGLQITEDELTELMKKVRVQASSELTEDDLEDVAGGANWKARLRQMARWLVI